jgi:hypothetical protein
MKFLAVLFIVFAGVMALYSIVKSWPNDRNEVAIGSLCLLGCLLMLWKSLFWKKDK